MVTINKLPIYKLLIIEIIKSGYKGFDSLSQILSKINLGEYLLTIDKQMKERKKGKKTSLSSTHNINIKYTMIKDKYGNYIFPQELIKIVENITIQKNLTDYNIIFKNEKEYKLFLIITEGKPFNSILFDSGIIKKIFLKHFGQNQQIKYNKFFDNYNLGRNSKIFEHQGNYIFLDKTYCNCYDFYDFKKEIFLEFEDNIYQKLININFIKWLKINNKEDYDLIIQETKKNYVNKLNKFKNRYLS